MVRSTVVLLGQLAVRGAWEERELTQVYICSTSSPMLQLGAGKLHTPVYSLAHIIVSTDSRFAVLGHACCQLKSIRTRVGHFTQR